MLSSAVALSFFYYVIEFVGLSAVTLHVCLKNALDLHVVSIAKLYVIMNLNLKKIVLFCRAERVNIYHCLGEFSRRNIYDIFLIVYPENNLYHLCKLSPFQKVCFETTKFQKGVKFFTLRVELFLEGMQTNFDRFISFRECIHFLKMAAAVQRIQS